MQLSFPKKTCVCDFPSRLHTLLIQVAGHCQVLKSKFCSSADAFPEQHHSFGIIWVTPFTCAAVLRLWTVDRVAGVLHKVSVAHKHSLCFDAHGMAQRANCWFFITVDHFHCHCLGSHISSTQLKYNLISNVFQSTLPQGLVIDRIYHHACVSCPCMDQR